MPPANSKPHKEIGKRLRVLREAWGERHGEKATQDVVAEMLGVHSQTYGAWERGEQRPEGTNLVNVANFYGVQPDEIISGVTVSRETPEPSHLSGWLHIEAHAAELRAEAMLEAERAATERARAAKAAERAALARARLTEGGGMTPAAKTRATRRAPPPKQPGDEPLSGEGEG